MRYEELSRIRQLLAEDQMEEATAALLNAVTGPPWREQAILLSSRWRSFQKELRQGLVYADHAAVDKNRIVYGYLGLLTEIEEKLAEDYLHGLDPLAASKEAAEQLLGVLAESYRGFSEQVKVRDLLARQLKERLGPVDHVFFEDLFERHYDQMNEDERKLHASIRHFTQNVIARYNQRALELVIRHPAMKEEVPLLRALERHLLVWLGKFEGLFQITPGMSLVYAGVKERVPFPSGVERQLRTYLAEIS